MNSQEAFRVSHVVASPLLEPTGLLGAEDDLFLCVSTFRGPYYQLKCPCPLLRYIPSLGLKSLLAFALACLGGERPDPILTAIVSSHVPPTPMRIHTGAARRLNGGG